MSKLIYQAIMKGLTLLFFIINSSSATSQISTDSAQTRFDEIYRIELSQPEKAIAAYLQLSTQLESDIDIGRANSYIGMVYLAQGKYDSLELYMSRAFALFEKTDYQRGIASVHNTLGNANLYRGFYNNGIIHYQKALPYYEQPGQEYNLTVILNNMASLFQHNGDQKTSLSYLQQALEISKKIQNSKALANSYNNISAAYTQLEDYPVAYNYADSAVTHINETDDTRLTILITSNLARLCANTSKIYRSKQLLKIAEKLVKDIDDIELRLTIDQTWAQYYLAIENYDQVLYFGERSLTQLKQFEDLSYEEETLNVLIAAAIAKNNSLLALRYSSMRDTVKSKSFLADKNRRVRELDATYHHSKQQAQLAAQQLQLTKQKGQQNLLIVMAILAGLIGLYAWSMMKRRKEKVQAQLTLKVEKIKLLEQEKRLNALDYIIQGQETERKRIAQDLHDGLGGLLTSVRRKVSNLQASIEDFKSTNIVREAEDMIENACEEVRRISHDMMPATLSSLGLEDAIEDLSADSIPPHINFHLSYNIKDNNLSESIKVNVFRIIQEIVNNTIKHSEASIIEAKLDIKNNYLYLDISDNGIGFDPYNTAKREGIGVKNITSRISYLGGQLELDSSKGTHYHISIPLIH